MDYFLTFTEHTFMITEPDWEDEGPWRDQGESGITVVPHVLSLSKPDHEHEWITANRYGAPEYCLDTLDAGQVAYVVIVNYQEGDTFGSSGYWTVAGVCSTPERAKDVKARCEGPDDEHYRKWDGYFCHLNSVDIYPLTVAP